MAVMKKKGNKGLPPISTASLPDVIFMILFFFMVSTTMRDQELLVRYKLPEATEVHPLPLSVPLGVVLMCSGLAPPNLG